MTGFKTITVPASGSYQDSTPAAVVTIQAASLPLNIAFNGGPNQNATAGAVLDQRPKGFNYFTFSNPNTVPVTVTYASGPNPVAYSASSNAVANAPTYPYGNLGVAVGSAANGAYAGSPQCDANGFLYITNAANIAIAGDQNGHRRQKIVFSMSTQSPAGLNILDANGFAFMTLAAGDKITLADDSVYYLSGAGGVAWVTIGQTFLQS